MKDGFLQGAGKPKLPRMRLYQDRLATPSERKVRVRGSIQRQGEVVQQR
jgi:hypothetical protein